MTSSQILEWPLDDDGDVFRSLQSQNFDFAREYAIDFNIDLSNEENVYQIASAIMNNFPDASVFVEDFEEPVYIRVELNGKVNYEYIVSIQKQLTQISSPWQGNCESWGLLH